MEGDFIIINKWLLPISWLYGCAVNLRNFLFDVGVLKSHSFDIPVISVGNLTVGGTGKTPHVEYLVRLLKKDNHIAVLSRGYKRKTHGFIIANEQSTAREIGDEPFQMKQKFPDITVAVDANRVNGITQLISQNHTIDAVLLDDAFQHRYVKPGINILLVDYHRLIIYDKMLPAGRLRESKDGKNRADIVVITKCPKDLRPMDFRVIAKAMNLYPYQQLFFTCLDYDTPYPVFKGEAKDTLTLGTLHDRHVLLLTGIASPEQLVKDLTPVAKTITPLTFPDHHDFSHKDLQLINDTFDSMPEPKVIITTEKDAARFYSSSSSELLSKEVRSALFALPIRIVFMLEQEEKFCQFIKSYIHKNSRYSILVKGKKKEPKEENPNRIVFK